MKKLLISLVFFMHFYPSCIFATNLSDRMDKMVAAGYSSSEIADIISGKKTVEETDWPMKMRAFGYSEQEIKEQLAQKQKQKVAILKKEKLVKNIKQPLFETWKYEKIIMPIILAACAQNGIEVSLLMAVIKAESSFNLKAVSPKGAIGLMQLMPGTASMMGVTDIFDPMQNIHGGAKYLAMMLQRFGRKDLALAAYNAGPEAVRNGRIPNIEETATFVNRVLHYERELFK